MVEDQQSGWAEVELELLGELAGHVAPDVVGEFGMTEEGDPWFVLEKPDGSALAHFARVDGKYVCAPSVPGGFDTNGKLLPLVLKFLGHSKKPACAG